MKKTFSYLWPFTKKINSDFSGILEVTWLNGKKVLNSKNANYSYGSLERVLDIGLSHTTADRSAAVLVLGLGGGSIMSLLRNKFQYYGKITAVEIDPAVIKIAKEEFDIERFKPLEILCKDALEYVQNTEDQYGLIIIDIFIDTRVPLAFYSKEFWQHIPRILEEQGSVIFNAGINFANAREIGDLQREMESRLAFEKLDHINGTNTLLLGTKKKK